MHPYPDLEAAAQACCDYILAAVSAARALRGTASLAVSGGSTPKALFQAMAAQPFDWAGVHLFFVDERCVGPQSALSNYGLARQHLLDPVKFPEAQVHRVMGELEPAEAAARYVGEIEAFFKAGEPRFDVIQHGMGDDAHTASLFPGEPLIQDTTGIAAPVYHRDKQQWRITLLPRVLRNARHTAFLVAGADKAIALQQVLAGAEDPMRYPAQIAARANGDREIAWFVDDEAAELCVPRSPGLKPAAG